MSAFDDTLDFIHQIQSAPTPEGMCNALLKVTAAYGLTNLIAGTMPLPGLRPAVARSHILFAGWPVDWMTRYVERSYVYVDPVIRRVQEDVTPFRWSDARPDPDRASDAATMMGEAGEHGLRVGYAVPLITLEGDVATVSFGGTDMDLPLRAAGVINLVATFAMGRAFELRQKADRNLRQPLTPREIDCVRWAAEGKTEWEISVILGISRKTAEHHLASARRKFGAGNRVHLIAEAIRHGLIR